MDDTLLKNITFGSNEEEVDIKKFKKCILDAELEKFVEELNNKEQTHLGEAGSKISGGQLQRIGIARALYNDPEILIFDESTSSLDLETEREIIKNIYKFKNLKTLIIISHKVDLLKGCNKIYKLENRKISKKND